MNQDFDTRRSGHLSNQQLLDHLLGLEDAGPHLEACAECQKNWGKVEARRAMVSKVAQPDARFFLRQRHAVLDRAERPATNWARLAWVPAAAAAVFVTGVFLSEPAPQAPGPESAAMALHSPELLEASWFEETYSFLEDHEPRAASPIRQLFDEGTVVE